MPLTLRAVRQLVCQELRSLQKKGWLIAATPFSAYTVVDDRRRHTPSSAGDRCVITAPKEEFSERFKRQWRIFCRLASGSWPTVGCG